MLRALGLLFPLLGGCLVLSSEAFRETEDPPLPVRAVTDPADRHPPAPEVTQAAVMQEILSHKRELGECVATESRRYGLPRGKLLLAWEILPSGAVSNIRVVDPAYARRAIAHCVAGVVATFRFPESAEGVAGIVFPFKF